MEKQTIRNIIDIIGKFKDLKRSGWVMYNIKLPESDADHSFGLALLVLLTAPENLDKYKCLKLALVHDLAEIYAGDFTPFDNITAQEKNRLETDAANRLADELNWPELIELVNEYNEKKTKEAVFVGLADKLETAMTAKYYDNNARAPRVLIDEFGAYAQKHADKYKGSELDILKEMIKSLCA